MLQWCLHSQTKEWTHIQTFPDTSEQKALKTLVFRVASPSIGGVATLCSGHCEK